MRFTIQHLSGSRAGQSQTLEATIVRMGRDPSCDVAFDPHADDAVSANHCQLLVMDDGRVQVVDQGSSNGTFLNGQPVGQVPVPVISGAVLRLGEEGPKISVMFEAAAAMPKTAAARPAAKSGGGRLLMCIVLLFLLLLVGAGGAALVYVLLQQEGEASASDGEEGEEPDDGEGEVGASPDGGEEPEASPEPSEAEAADDEADLSHVKVGQVYVYEMQNNMQSEWKVLEVETNYVKYAMTTIMDMGQGPAPVGDPIEGEWRYEKVEATGEESDEPQPETSRESVTVSDVEFDCLVVESEAGGAKTKSWVSMSPGSETVPTFPGAIKSTMGDDPSMVLVEIRPPE